jgi:hypothetical protein
MKDKRCPRCDSEDTVEIVYGYPGPELVEASMAGKVVLGGCLVVPNAPERVCRACRHEWHDSTAP